MLLGLKARVFYESCRVPGTWNLDTVMSWRHCHSSKGIGDRLELISLFL